MMAFSTYRYARQALICLLLTLVVGVTNLHLLDDGCVLVMLLKRPSHKLWSYALCKDLDEWGVGKGAMPITGEMMGKLVLFGWRDR